MGDIAACGLCGGHDLTLLLDMGDQPLAERYDSDRAYPLALLECQDCTLVQLSHIVDQAEVFPYDHPYASGNTGALRQHFAALAHKLAPLLAPGDLVIDIGANDGTLLSEFSGGLRRVAVEPTNQARKCRERGIVTYREFFCHALAAGLIAEQHGSAKVITATNVLAHVPRPHDFLEGVAYLLAPDGVFVTENHDVASITEGLQFDTVYHEHLRYYSIATVSRLLAMHGLQVTEVERIPTHGGSLRVFARKLRGDLAERAGYTALALNNLLEAITAGGGSVYGIGATTRATPLLHYARIAQYLTCVCEVPNSEKIGRMMPGTDIPIVDEVRLLEDQPSHALLFSWHIAEGITRKLRTAGYRGKFITPLPVPRIIGD